MPPPSVRRLGDRVPSEPIDDPERVLDLFLEWVGDVGLEPYPAQEEALLEVVSGKHVVLDTPTGSGKSLVALAVHFQALCEGKTSFYTSPIKALASEKFFDLCDQLGAERVGMQTGDASINPEAPIVCCTAEVLANRALRQARGFADSVVMDEFHYYGDTDRGVAWQVPLLMLPRTRFLLMSATIGNPMPIAEKLEAETGVEAVWVHSRDRPVPLDFDYSERSLHETVEELLASRRAPVYIVSFTQRECAELAQALTSARVSEREERDAIRKEIGDFRFDTPYGKDIRRYLGFGIGLHHAGLLPKYRLLVEQLAQKGLLKVICGTDTLGVGVNIPIRTVLFSKLIKYDGEKVGILKVRDFQQISGRAGRKGFDDRGWVVCQAPDHAVERRKADENPRKKSKRKPKGPPAGQPDWNEETFRSLIHKPPEMLESRFKLTHGMVLDTLVRDAEVDDPNRRNFATLRDLIARCHENDHRKKELLSEAAVLVRSLHRAGILAMEKDSQTDYRWVVAQEDLQWDFSLFQALSLFLVEAIERLDAASETYTLDLVTFVEAILENPRAVLYRQVDRLKTDLVNRLKAEGVPYEERMARLEEVSWPKPRIELVRQFFEDFRSEHPWVRGEDLHPKSIAREMFEDYWSFQGYVRHYRLQRSEGVLLRYLSQFYKTLSHSVPERSRTEGIYDVLGYFRTLIAHTDTSLLEEWESLVHPELALESEDQRESHRREIRLYELFHDPKAFAARVRAELHQLVRALADEDWEEAALAVRQLPESHPEDLWPPERFAEELGPFLAEFGRIVFDHRSRLADKTAIRKVSDGVWEVSQVLCDPEEDDLWALHGEIDLSAREIPEGPLVRLIRVGT